MFCLQSDRGAEGRQTNLANLCQLCVMFSRISARENVVFSFHALLFYDARSLPNLFVGAESAPDPTGGAYDALQSPDPLVNYERWTPSLFPIPSSLDSVGGLDTTSLRLSFSASRFLDFTTMATPGQCRRPSDADGRCQLLSSVKYRGAAVC